MHNAIHQILRKIRVDRGLSQENIAEELKVDQTTYRRYETGDTPIKFEHVEKIASFYEMGLDEFANYGNPDYVKQIKTEYVKNRSISITVELDGKDDTLNYWITKLTDINNVI